MISLARRLRRDVANVLATNRLREMLSPPSDIENAVDRTRRLIGIFGYGGRVLPGLRVSCHPAYNSRVGQLVNRSLPSMVRLRPSLLYRRLPDLMPRKWKVYTQPFF